MNRISKKQALDLLRELLETIPTVDSLSEITGDPNDPKKWYDLVKTRTKIIFGDGSDHYNNVLNNPPEGKDATVFITGYYLPEAIDELRKEIESMFDEIINTWPDDENKSTEVISDRKLTDTGRIFVVYGHDTQALASAKNLVYKLGLEPITLPERESKGQTVIEKFERLSKECCFALVLLTPDDVGGEKTAKDLKDRARQNVILELGYFYGLLGRERVIVAYKKGVELPSDIHGIIYSEFRNDVSKIKDDLIKELDSCGIKHKR